MKRKTLEEPEVEEEIGDDLEEVDVQHTDVKTDETEEGKLDPDQERYYRWTYRLRDMLAYLTTHALMTD